MLLGQHHIITDGWSVKVLVDELAELYSARRARRVAATSRSCRSSTRTSPSGSASNCPARHCGAPGLLEAPAFRPRAVRTAHRPAPAPSAYHGWCDIPARPAGRLVERLARIGQDGSATLFMALTAAVQVLLAQYSGQQDIAIGAATSGRNRAELENLAGFFVNTVVLRARWIGPAPSTTSCPRSGKRRWRLSTTTMRLSTG